jgi:prophage antirepressor-like protein
MNGTNKQTPNEIFETIFGKNSPLKTILETTEEKPINKKEGKMNSIIKFNFNGTPVSIIDRDGGVWFLAKDVCNVLGLTNPTESLRALDEDEKSSLRITEGTSSIGGNPNMNIINEPGLYKLIFRSRKEIAKTFTKWVTSEVLPSIRKKGYYVDPLISINSKGIAINKDAIREAIEIGELKSFSKDVTEEIRIALLCALDEYPSTKELARSVSLDPVTIRDIIKGKYPKMSRRTWLKISPVIKKYIQEQHDDSVIYDTRGFKSSFQEDDIREDNAYFRGKSEGLEIAVKEMAKLLEKK